MPKRSSPCRLPRTVSWLRPRCPPLADIMGTMLPTVSRADSLLPSPPLSTRQLCYANSSVPLGSYNDAAKLQKQAFTASTIIPQTSSVTTQVSSTVSKPSTAPTPRTSFSAASVKSRFCVLRWGTSPDATRPSDVLKARLFDRS